MCYANAQSAINEYIKDARNKGFEPVLTPSQFFMLVFDWTHCSDESGEVGNYLEKRSDGNWYWKGACPCCETITLPHPEIPPGLQDFIDKVPLVPDVAHVTKEFSCVNDITAEIEKRLLHVEVVTVPELISKDLSSELKHFSCNEPFNKHYRTYHSPPEGGGDAEKWRVIRTAGENNDCISCV